MIKMRRVKVLFDLDQYQKLAEIARQSGTSISFQVRLAIDQWMARQSDRQPKIDPSVGVDRSEDERHEKPSPTVSDCVD